MLSEIQNGIAAFQGLKGVRNILWTLLIAGLGLMVFESVTQYFSVSALQSKTELLIELNRIETTQENSQILQNLNSELIEEATYLIEMANNPSLYIANVLVRFFKGFYLSLPLFYLFFKAVTFFYRNAEKEVSKNPKIQKMALFFGSILFSVTLWMATMLGAASVLWNKSENLFVSWLVFPVASIALLLLTILWFFSLRILMPGIKQEVDKGE